jgi:hypothetical protein
MGCDFYTYYVVHIQYMKDGNVETITEEFENTRKRHYFVGCEERDEDFEEMRDYNERWKEQMAQQVTNALRSYDMKHIYAKGEWMCIDSAKEKYLELCNEYEIDEANLVSIWREGDYCYR